MTDVFMNWKSVTDSMKLRNGSAFGEDGCIDCYQN